LLKRSTPAAPVKRNACIRRMTASLLDAPFFIATICYMDIEFKSASDETGRRHRAASEERPADWRRAQHPEASGSQETAMEDVMLYPAYIYPGDAKHGHGVQFPDFPDCNSAADDWADIPLAAQEAVEAHFADGEPVPPPSAFEGWLRHPDYQEAPGCFWTSNSPTARPKRWPPRSPRGLSQSWECGASPSQME
jgi:predicted RNase H-like HicB family nuclease